MPAPEGATKGDRFSAPAALTRAEIEDDDFRALPGDSGVRCLEFEQASAGHHFVSHGSTGIDLLPPARPESAVGQGKGQDQRHDDHRDRLAGVHPRRQLGSGK